MSPTTLLGARLFAAAAAACVLLLGFPVSARGTALADAWIRVDTERATVSVVVGERAVLELGDISIGRGGATRERLMGDHRTPLGEFRVAAVRTPSQFHRFYVFSYPDLTRARLALQKGDITQSVYRNIAAAHRAGRLPPQNTSLGGNLGIHGLGGADRHVHSLFNWTQGCVALTDEQIDKLDRWIRIGTRVVVE